MAEIHDAYDTILILDFGSQYSHLITRRCRELNVYAELMPCTQKISELAWKPKGIILSGSPYSVYDEDAPHVDPDVFTFGVPVLGICYGLQELALHFGGKVGGCDHREYGHADVEVIKLGPPHEFADKLLDGLEDQLQVWMSHGDQISEAPQGFQVVGRTKTSPFTAIAHESKPLFGIQFHPEVTHTPKGKEIIGRFVLNICNCEASWTMESFISKEITRIRELVGTTAQVIGAVSGGVDSSVAAKLMHEAIGDRFHAILVDNGVLRLNEAAQVKKTLKEDLGVNLHVADASSLFLERLAGIEDPEQKRRIIGNTFINVFEEEGTRIEGEVAQKGRGKVEFLLQGTLYPDVIESISFKGPSATIKTHHNVGGLLKDMKLKLIEPLRELFKGESHSLPPCTIPYLSTDEVRALGRLLFIPPNLVNRHPFPGPGLAIRILGPVTPEQVQILQKADNIYIEEIRAAGLYEQISQAFAVLLPVKAVGVMGDKRTYEQVIALRAVQSEDFMTADWFAFPPAVLRKISSRITNEVAGVNRVTYDISSKPPGTIEWL